MNIIPCPKCQYAQRPENYCPNCGYYWPLEEPRDWYVYNSKTHALTDDLRGVEDRTWHVYSLAGAPGHGHHIAGGMSKKTAYALRALPSLVEALATIAQGDCCQTPGCCIEGPMCDPMIAHAALAEMKPPE